MSEKTFYILNTFASRWMNGIFKKFTNIEFRDIHCTASLEQFIGRISSIFKEVIRITFFCSRSMSFNLIYFVQPYAENCIGW